MEVAVVGLMSSTPSSFRLPGKRIMDPLHSDYSTARKILSCPGHAKLEVVTKLALPEPELQFSTNGDTSKGVVVGMGDVNIGIEEFNLLLEY